MDSTTTKLGTNQLFLSLTLVTVNCITGGRDDLPGSEVAVADWPRLLVRMEATYPQVRAATGNGLNRIDRKPNETIVAAASRLSDAFRSSIVDRDHPYLSKIIFLWRCTPEDKL